MDAEPQPAPDAWNRTRRYVRPAALIACALLGCVLLAMAVVAFALAPSRTTFNVTATTERVRMWFGAERPVSRWQLDDVELEEQGQRATKFSGSLEFADSVDVIIQRVAMGELWISARSRRPTRSVGRYYGVGDVPLGDAPDAINIYVPDLPARANAGRTVILAVFGDVELGLPLGINTAGSGALLRSGKVSLIGRSAVRGDPFQAGAVELDAGDAVRVSDPEGAAVGFVVADERPALTAAYYVRGRTMQVTRPGGGTYPISASGFQSLTHDRLSQVVSGVFALLAALVSLAPIAAFARRKLRPAVARYGPGRPPSLSADDATTPS